MDTHDAVINVAIKEEPMDNDESNVYPYVQDEAQEEYKSNDSDIADETTNTVGGCLTSSRLYIKEESNPDSYFNVGTTCIKEENNELYEDSGNLQLNESTFKLETEETIDECDLDQNKIESKVGHNTIFQHEEHDALDTVEPKDECEGIRDHQIRDDNVHSDDTNEINNGNFNSIVREHFKCQYCDKAYSTKGILIAHLQKHNKYLFQCGVCEDVFENANELRKHKILHPNAKRDCFTCQYCDKLFKSRQGWKDHETIHTGKPYKCETCGKLFTSTFGLKRHRKIHINEKSNTTKKAKKTYMHDNNELQSNKASDTVNVNDKPEVKERFQCQDCPKSYSTKSHLRDHSIIHHPYTFQCEVCGDIFGNSREHKQHMMLHKKGLYFKCKYCDKLFARAQHCATHETIHTGKPHKCEICEKFYSSIKILKEHKKRVHTGEESNVSHLEESVTSAESHNDANENNDAKQENDIKDKFSENKTSLKGIHENSPVEETSLNCCGIKFSSTKTLELHKNLHAPLKCQFCHKTFSRRHMLKRHELNHTREMTFKCQFCNKGFKTYTIRNTHEKLRCRYGKPYKCRHCGKGYTILPLLKAHEKAMHINKH